MEQMNQRGRVSLCGAISMYNTEGESPKGNSSFLLDLKGVEKCSSCHMFGNYGN